MNTHLQESFQRNVLNGEMNIYAFFDSLKEESLEDVIGLMDWILSEFSYSDNPSLIKAVFTKLAHIRETNYFSKFEELRNEWRNTFHNQYEYLQALFLNAIQGAKCNCNIYQDGMFNVAPYQDELEILYEDTREKGPYTFQVLNLRCKICLTEWEVEVDHIYHYPHSHWRKLSKPDRDDVRSGSSTSGNSKEQ